MTTRERISIEDFDAYVHRPENSDRLFELIEGKIVEVPTNPRASEIANLISFFIRLFLREKQIAGHVTSGDGGYRVGNELYAPDVAYISFEKQPDLAEEGYNPIPPELAVEVVSSNRADELNTLRTKITSYLAVGTVVWVVQPADRRVEIHAPGRATQIFEGDNDTLKDDLVLHGFELPLRDIFKRVAP